MKLIHKIKKKKKKKKKNRTSNWWPHIATKTCFEGPPRGILRTSWRRPGSTSQGCSLNVRLGRPQDVRSRRPWDGQIGSLGGVLGKLEEDLLGTSWGPIFVSWEKCNFLLIFCTRELLEMIHFVIIIIKYILYNYLN